MYIAMLLLLLGGGEQQARGQHHHSRTQLRPRQLQAPGKTLGSLTLSSCPFWVFLHILQYFFVLNTGTITEG